MPTAARRRQRRLRPRSRPSRRRPRSRQPAEPSAAPRPRDAELVDVAFPEMGDSVAEGTVLEWRVGPATASRSTTPWSRSRPTRSTPRCPPRWPAPFRRSSSSRPDRGRRLRFSAGSPRAPAQRPPAATDGSGPTRRRGPETRPAAGAPASGNGGNATPVAARIASAHGLDLSAVAGSGPRGRVTKEDVLAAVEGNGAPRRPRRAAPPRPAPRPPHPRARGHARQVHEREPLDPDGHELPHAPGRRARRPPQGAEGAAAGSSRSPT